MIGKIGELRMNKVQMPSARLDQPLSAGNGGRIAIKSNDTGTGLKDRCRITARPERAIENDPAGLRIERFEHLRQKNRNVANRPAFGFGFPSTWIRHHSDPPS